MDDSLTLFSKAIRSSVPGRLRIRLPILKGIDSDSTELLSVWLKSRVPSADVTINPRVGSALITWNPAKDSLDIESLLSEAADYLQAAQALGLIHTKGERLNLLKCPLPKNGAKLFQRRQSTWGTAF